MRIAYFLSLSYLAKNNYHNIDPTAVTVHDPLVMFAWPGTPDLQDTTIR
jgi:hypothetical protein